MVPTELKQIYKKLNEIDSKLSALLVKEEKASTSEKRAIKKGEKEFLQGKYSSWKSVKARYG